MDKEKVTEGLHQDLLGKSVETRILAGIGEMVNCFVSIDKELKELVMENAETQKNFVMLAALACMYMGYTYMCETEYGRGHWDLRNEVSSRYCFEHRKKLERIFEEASGIEIRFAEDAQHQSFRRDCLLLRGIGGYRALAEEIEAFAKEHPTLQQRMMGAFIRLLDEMYPGYGLEQIRFPFI